jgi:GTPase SAR1 family protein
MTQIETHAPSDVCKVLLATKCDLNFERQVSTEEGAAVARKYGIPFIEVSAKSDLNVKEGF